MVLGEDLSLILSTLESATLGNELPFLPGLRNGPSQMPFTSRVLKKLGPMPIFNFPAHCTDVFTPSPQSIVNEY